MKTSLLAALALVCLLSGSGWLFEQIFPRAIGFPHAGFVHFLVIGIGASVVAFVTGSMRLPAAQSAQIMLEGALVFALPSIAFGLSSASIAGFTSLALFCSVPLLTVLILNGIDLVGVSEEGSSALLTTALGLGGVLLLFPVQLPGALKGWLYFAFVGLCCGLVALASIWMHKVLRGVSIATATAYASFGSTALLGLCGALKSWSGISLRSIAIECVRCLLFDLPVVWLTVWLIREIHPLRLSARFLLIPLLAAAEGYAAMGGAGIDLRAACAMLLMAGSGVILISQNEKDNTTDHSTLHLR
jgi:hypothetical protein